jgi:hypothetical protein
MLSGGALSRIAGVEQDRHAMRSHAERSPARVS